MGYQHLVPGSCEGFTQRRGNLYNLGLYCRYALSFNN